MVNELEDTAKKLQPLMGKEIERLWNLYLAGDMDEKKRIEKIIRLLAVKHLPNHLDDNSVILLPPPKANSVKGKYPMAEVIYGKEKCGTFGLEEDEWTQHLAVFGRSGAGKTNVAFLILSNLLRRNKPFLIFDWKRNYRDLIASNTIGHKILVFTPGRALAPFSFNPLIPPKGIAASTWLKKLIDILCQSYYVGEGVAYLLQKALHAVYEKCGMYSGKATKQPNFADVAAFLEEYKAKGRELNWLASTLRVIGSLCYGEYGKVLNVREQIPIDDLLKKNVVFELDSLTRTEKTFLIESLLLWIHHYRLAEGGRETFKHAIMIEEAHNILEKGEQASRETVMDKTLREIRELGESLIILDQMPSKVSTTALANCYTTITLNTKWKADVAVAANYSLLDSEQKKFLGLLGVGQGIVKLQGRCVKPFLVEFPLVRIAKGTVTDEMIKKHMGSHLRYFTYSAEILDVEKLNQDIPVIPPDRKKEENEEPEQLPELEMRLLKDIAKHPHSGIVERDKRLCLSRRKGNALNQKLIKNKYAKVVSIPMHNGHIKLMDLTEKATAILSKAGIKTLKRHGRESLEHSFWKHRIADYYKKKGFRVDIEQKLDNGHVVDILATKPNISLAIEIETGKSDAIGNIKRSLAAGCTVISACTSLAATNGLRQELRKNIFLNQASVRIVPAQNSMW